MWALRLSSVRCSNARLVSKTTSCAAHVYVCTRALVLHALDHVFTTAASNATVTVVVVVLRRKENNVDRTVRKYSVIPRQDLYLSGQAILAG